jgi:hypothetical protein
MDRATKSTFLLSDVRRAKLKAIGAERKKTVTELLAEGADLVIEKYRGLADADELARAAARSRELLRRGLYAGPSVSSKADKVLYPTRRKRR